MKHKLYEGLEVRIDDAIKEFEALKREYEEDRRIYEVRYDMADKYNEIADKNHFKGLARKALANELFYGMAIAALKGDLVLEMTEKTTTIGWVVTHIDEEEDE